MAEFHSCMDLIKDLKKLKPAGWRWRMLERLGAIEAATIHVGTVHKKKVTVFRDILGIG